MSMGRRLNMILTMTSGCANQRRQNLPSNHRTDYGPTYDLDRKRAKPDVLTMRIDEKERIVEGVTIWVQSAR